MHESLAVNGAVILSRSNVSSVTYYYGVVRVYYNGWGNICDDIYCNAAEAHIICHQLGYSGASSYSRAGLVRYDTCVLLVTNIVINFSYGTDYSGMMLTVL